ncbi:MAG: hypothetical protein K1X75_08560 [Leptospirales bacterium]|nr:hypothetical protein [Leptospirales bacterium]
MKRVLELFDRLTAGLPPAALQIIRLGALLLWLLGAVVVSYFAWNRGGQSAPQRGQDLSLSEIRERVEREQNLHRTGDLNIPDLNELVPEQRPYRSPYEHEDQRAVDLAGEDSRLQAPAPPQAMEGRNESLPFVGENRLSPVMPPPGRSVEPPPVSSGMLPLPEDRRPLPDARPSNLERSGDRSTPTPSTSGARPALLPSAAEDSNGASGRANTDDLPFLPE